MAARKLQTEIDRTLKKVAEGVELFEAIYDKMQASTNQTQKEKQELDLKTQIKKLQRLRDQIKTWVANNDIKDKSQLLENRRLIETQMEKFKACEKEMKTKAFSKEGLIQAAKLDPKEQEKEEATSWLQTQVEELQMQVEQTEAEIEALQGTGKKKNKAGSSAAGRQEELEALNERRKWHISRLEIILRLLNNGSLATEKVLGLKDDVSYFVESNTEEDFDEDEGIYDELNLDEEEEKFGLVLDDDDSDESDVASEDLPHRTNKKHDEESVTSSKREESPVMKKAPVMLNLRKPHVPAEVVKPPPNPNFAQQPMASIVKAGLQPQPRPPPLPPIRYAAAAAANVSTPTTQGTPSHASSQAQPAPALTPVSSVPNPPPSTAQALSPSGIGIGQQTGQSSAAIPPQSTSQGSAVSSPSLTHPSVTSPMLSSASVSHQPDGSFYSGQESPALSDAVPSSSGGPAAASEPRKDPVSLQQPTFPSPSATRAYLPSEPPHPPANGSTQTTESSVSVPVQQLPVLSPLPQQVQQHPPVPVSNAPPPPLQQQPQPQQQQPQFPPGVKVPHGVAEAASTASGTIVQPQQHQQNQSQASSQIIGSQRVPSETASQPVSVPRSTASSAFPGSLSDLVMSFENVKQKAAHRMNNLDQVHKLLEGGYSSVPQPQDTEKAKYYVPRNPFQTPVYYPQTPHPLLSTAGIFSQLDVETLFYVFYFLPGTYQQYLAAKELKQQSWRFHLKYLTWFQRHSEPQAITEEYEQGVYVYFDWEGSWCQRKKSDFRFEYRYLSDD